MTASIPQTDAGMAPSDDAIPEEYGSVLLNAGLFYRLSSEVIDAVIRDMHGIRLARGERLFNQGDPGDRLYIVLAGKVKLAQHLGHGKERLIALLGPGDQFGELSLLDPGPRMSTAVIIADAYLAWLDKPALHRWLTKHPEVAQQLLRVIARRLRRTRTELADTIFVDVSGRVAKNLILLGRRFGTRAEEQWQVPHDLTQTELAQLVGASRETVNKALSDFANRGWLQIEQGSVVILDPTRLKIRAGLTRR